MPVKVPASVQKAFDKFTTEHPVFAIIIFFVVSLSTIVTGVGTFADAIPKIGKGYEYVAALITDRELSDGALVKRSQELAKEIMKYVGNRRLNEPAYDFDDFEAASQARQKYTHETLNYYKTNFLPDVSLYQIEFLKRGLKNGELDWLYANPTNYLGIEKVATALFDLSSSLQSGSTQPVSI